MTVRIAVTGGPCAGKSTAIEALRLEYGDRIIVTPEVATMLLGSGYPAAGGQPAFLEWLFNFQRSVGSVQMGMEDDAVLRAESREVPVVVFDRGLCDSEAYIHGDASYFYDIFGITKQQALARYDLVIHLQSVAACRPELYGKGGNEHRMETLEEAQAVEAQTLAAWSDHPNRVVVPGGDGIDAVVARVLSLVSEHLEFEVERKFLLWKLPDLAVLNVVRVLDIEQGYLGESDVRLRRQGSETFMTVKSPGGLRRREWERRVPEWVFDELWPSTADARVSKTRYVIEEDGQTYELDDYHGALSGLCTVELSAGDVVGGAVPAWFGANAEVTEDRRFRNRSLADGGCPSVEAQAELLRMASPKEEETV